MIKKVIVGTEESNLTTNGETRKCLLIIKPSAATCACRNASHILTDGEAMNTVITNFFQQKNRCGRGRNRTCLKNKYQLNSIT